MEMVVGNEYMFKSARFVYDNKTYRYKKKSVTKKVIFLGFDNHSAIFSANGKQLIICADDIPEKIKEVKLTKKTDGEKVVLSEIKEVLKKEKMQKVCMMWDKGYLCMHELMAMVAVEIANEYNASEFVSKKMIGGIEA